MRSLAVTSKRWVTLFQIKVLMSFIKHTRALVQYFCWGFAQFNVESYSVTEITGNCVTLISRKFKIDLPT
jgi:hypothetical protein